MRAFIALELKNVNTLKNIQSFGSRLIQNQPRLKLVEMQNLHLTVKFLGDIPDSKAPKIFKILKEQVNDELFEGKVLEYQLVGAGQFSKFSVIWIGLKGDLKFLQTIKDVVEAQLHSRLKIERDRRQQFKPHLTIGRLKTNRINYKTFDVFKKLLQENRDLEFGAFTISEIKLKKSVLTSKGPIYTDLIYD